MLDAFKHGLLVVQLGISAHLPVLLFYQQHLLLYTFGAAGFADGFGFQGQYFLGFLLVQAHARDFGVDLQKMQVILLGVDESFAPPTEPRVPGRILAMASGHYPILEMFNVFDRHDVPVIPGPTNIRFRDMVTRLQRKRLGED